MLASEAMTKHCPFSIAPVVTSINHNDNTVSSCHSIMKCICSNCLAWVDTTEKEVCEGKIIKKIYPKPELSGYCVRLVKC